MNILKEIIAHKKDEVETQRLLVPVNSLKQSVLYKRETISLYNFLMDETKTGIIAEFKRRSPSKGIINNTAMVADVTKAYTENGASALSVLTDEHFFGGNNADLIAARENHIPILRKDFIVDEYQITEAKSIGADVILLIAACLTPERLRELAIFAQQLGLEVLLEIHVEAELEHICDEIKIVGINNRDLKTFAVDINRSVALSRKIPVDRIKVAESGISNVETIDILKQTGFKGFLMGENFMRTNDPGFAFKQFVQQLK